MPRAPPGTAVVVQRHAAGECGNGVVGHLRALCNGLALPVGELARRVGCTANAMSKQMALVEKTGVAVQTYGRLYIMAPHFLPPPGATVLDLGQLMLKLTPPA